MPTIDMSMRNQRKHSCLDGLIFSWSTGGSDVEVRESLRSADYHLGLHRVLCGVDDVWSDGNSDSRPAQSQLDPVRASHCHSDPERRAVSTAARHLDGSIRGSGNYAAFAGGLRGPAVDLVVRDRTLAVSATWPRACAGRRFLLGGHTLC